jgi:hypothetical protein
MFNNPLCFDALYLTEVVNTRINTVMSLKVSGEKTEVAKRGRLGHAEGERVSAQVIEPIAQMTKQYCGAEGHPKAALDAIVLFHVADFLAPRMPLFVCLHTLNTVADEWLRPSPWPSPHRPPPSNSGAARMGRGRFLFGEFSQGGVRASLTLGYFLLAPSGRQFEPSPSRTCHLVGWR